MIDNQIRTSYGSLRQSDRSGERSVTPSNTPANANIPAPQNVPQNPSVGFATHVIAADILLAAQESRPVRENRIDDAVQANSAYAKQTKAKQDRDTEKQPDFSAFGSADTGAEIIPLRAQYQDTSPVQDVLSNDREDDGVRASTRQASRAYITAGAAGGHGFGQATTNSTQLYGDGLNIII